MAQIIPEPGTRQLETNFIAQSLPELFLLTNPMLFALVCFALPLEAPLKVSGFPHILAFAS